MLRKKLREKTKREEPTSEREEEVAPAGNEGPSQHEEIIS